MTAADDFAFAAQCVAVCSGGFDNEHHWAAWKKKHQAQINALPPHLRKRVWAAYDNASAKEFSQRTTK